MPVRPHSLVHFRFCAVGRSEDLCDAKDPKGSYGLNSYGLSSNGLSSYGLSSYGAQKTSATPRAPKAVHIIVD